MFTYEELNDCEDEQENHFHIVQSVNGGTHRRAYTLPGEK